VLTSGKLGIEPCTDMMQVKIPMKLVTAAFEEIN
jgi:hypothetical protein